MRRRSAAASLIVLLAGAAACDRSAPAPSVDPAVYSEARDLAAELPLAEIHRETHRIDFGDAGSRRHLLEGWGADEIDGLDATTFAWGLGVSSLVEFTVLEPRNLKVVGRCRAFRWQDAQRQTVTVEVNGRRIRDLRLEGKMTEIRFTLPAEDLARGRNRLRFLYSYHGSPSRVIPGSADSRQLAVAWDFLRFGTERDELTLVAGAEGLFVPAGSEMRTYFRLDGPGYLLIDGLERGGRGRRLRVSVRVDGGVEGSEWVIEVPSGPTAIDLGNPPVSLVEIRLTALPARSGSGDPSGVLVRAPELRSRPTPTDAPVPATEAAPPGRPHVIVYLVDTLRADHLGCYGYPRPTSPAIDAFADEAVLFENTLAQSSWTRSSVASMMTGTVPTVHGVHDRDDALAAEAKTLAELLAAESYETAAFLTNRSVGPSFGFQQGFDTFELFDRQETEALYPKSDAVNREVFQWLDERGEEPFFLYVHTMDPHAPYAPPAEMREEIAPDVGSGELDTEEQVVFEELLASRSTRFGESSAFGSVTWLQALGQGLIAATPERTADLVALYDAEISFNDRSFGIFLDQLRRRGLYDDALIFFVGDHGEEFADHGGWSHGLTLFQEQLRVPFLVKLPAGAHGGTRSRELAQHVDLMPTVLDALGLPLPDDVQGRSLLPSPRSTASEPRPGYSHLDLDGRRAASLVEGRFKLTCDQTIDETCRVYDLENDPAESIDLTAERPVLAGYLRSRMRTFQTEAPALDAPQVEIDPELRERLEALGYL